MAKITGPLGSITASGLIGPRLTFSNRKSGQQVRFQRSQKDFNSAGRAVVRSNYGQAVGAWGLLTNEEKHVWNLKAKSNHLKMSGWNLFMKEFTPPTPPTSHDVIFDANSGSGSMANQTINVGDTVNLNICTFSKSGYSFDGWATSSGGDVVYSDGGSFTMGTSDVTLYAHWTLVPAFPPATIYSSGSGIDDMNQTWTEHDGVAGPGQSGAVPYYYTNGNNDILIYYHGAGFWYSYGHGIEYYRGSSVVEELLIGWYASAGSAGDGYTPPTFTA